MRHPGRPAFTDEALALRFAELHEDELRYVASWSKWLHWTGTRWQPDETLFAFDLARAVCREAAGECNDTKIATVLASARTVAAVERLARSDRRLAATSDQWDRDLWLLNTPAGTVDLRTGSDASTRTVGLHHQGHGRRARGDLSDLAGVSSIRSRPATRISRSSCSACSATR